MLERSPCTTLSIYTRVFARTMNIDLFSELEYTLSIYINLIRSDCCTLTLTTIRQYVRKSEEKKNIYNNNKYTTTRLSRDNRGLQ